MAEEALDARELVEALNELNDNDDDAEEFFPLNDLPNDVLVSVFAAVEDPTWVRHTVPFVCKAWNELYCTKDASPLHERLTLDFKDEVKSAWQEWLRVVARPVAGAAATQELAPYRPVVHASRVIPWAQTRAGSVRELRLDCGYGGALKDFSSKDLGRLVAVVGPSLTAIQAGSGLGELFQKPFWKSLRGFVVPAGRLRSFVVEGIISVVNESDVKPLGQLAGSLEELVLSVQYRIEGMGLPRFPESLCALKKLRRLDLYGHKQITAIPAEISSLKKLEALELDYCDLSSLPKELGELSGLTRLDLGGNENLGTALPAAEAFPAELGNLKSLRELRLWGCRLRTIPAFVCELESLEVLRLYANDGLQIDAPLDFLLEGCPRLRHVNLLHSVPLLPWTPESRAHLEAFKAKLLAKNPKAEVMFTLSFTPAFTW